MNSKWILWTFVPVLNWAGWIHAGIRANENKYFYWALLYSVPFMLTMVFHEEPVDGKYSATHNAVMSLTVIGWIVGIIHAQLYKQEIDSQIQAADKAQEPVKRIQRDLNQHSLNQGIASDSPVQPLITPASAASTTTPEEMMNSTNNTATFEQWYCEKFEWFVSQPMPWRIVFQVLLWLFYGFIWIPIWYAISDKQLTGSNTGQRMSDAAPPEQARVPQPSRSPPAPSPPPRSVQPEQSVGAKPPTVPAAAAAPVIDLNHAAEQEIAGLPGIGPILAKRVIQLRQAEGGFSSVDELAQLLNLKPHVLEQLRPRVMLGQRARTEADQGTKRGGRVVDF
jgi:hypothetical protein